MSDQGDARLERQSSSPNLAPLAGLSGAKRIVRGAFVVFVAAHLACEAYRARTSGALPAPGVEAEPWFVAVRLLLVWFPFAILAVLELRQALPGRARRAVPAANGQARALAVMEPVALGVVLLFAVVHGWLLAEPVLRGTLGEGEVRVELSAALSSTVHGFPGQAVGYLCGVGAASFYATRQALRLGARARPAAARAAIALGVACYLLGSYAVIRCASGALLP